MKTQLTTMDEFDLLFKNFFNGEDIFSPLRGKKLNYPVDIYESETGLNIEVAATGLKKEDINLEVEGDILSISYTKSEWNESEKVNYIHQGIAKRSFNIGYKISSKFDVSMIEAEMQNGLLKIKIPFSKQEKTSKTKLTIN